MEIRENKTKNRIEDLDFAPKLSRPAGDPSGPSFWDPEDNSTEGPLRREEFTKRAARRFRQVVSLDSFEDEDADVIFHYLFKEMELVSFGDYLKRYVYERAGIDQPFEEVPQETFREIVTDSFKETCTPKSMTPTTAKLSSLVNNWLTQSSVKRDTVFLLGFGLRMSPEDVSAFLMRVLKEQDFDFHNPEEVIYYYCLKHRLGWPEAERLKGLQKELPGSPGQETAAGPGPTELETEEQLLSYLSWLKKGFPDPLSEKNIAFQEFVKLTDQAKEIICAMYQQDEEEKQSGRVWTPREITASDLEKVICSGIPVNKMGNLRKMSASILAKHFSQKRFSRQRITNIINHRFPVERFDLITLMFFIISQTMQDDDPYERFREFQKRMQEILRKCGMGEIYIVNPYESFILMCLLTDCPLAVFSDIWEKSYEEAE